MPRYLNRKTEYYISVFLAEQPKIWGKGGIARRSAELNFCASLIL